MRDTIVLVAGVLLMFAMIMFSVILDKESGRACLERFLDRGLTLEQAQEACK